MFEKIQTNDVSKNSFGNLPATTAILSNNQIGKYISRQNATILKNVFSATANGFGKSFYQPYEFTVFQDSYAFKFKDESINIKKIHPFINTALNKIYSKYDWVNKSRWEKIKNEFIQLPIKNNKIDFDFMENFIAGLEAERLAGLEAYLKVNGLKDYKLTKEEEKAVNSLSTTKFKEFNITSVFDIKNTKNILSRDIIENSGSIPYLCASAENNAVSSYISYKEELIDKGNCIFIGGKTFVVTYQENDFYSNDSHNLVLYLKEGTVTKANQLYMATCINKGLGYKYSWGDSISGKKILKDKIMLPINNDGTPDLESMELFISAIKKLVIKDVVLYADNKIKATKEVIKKHI